MDLERRQANSQHYGSGFCYAFQTDIAAAKALIKNGNPEEGSLKFDAARQKLLAQLSTRDLARYGNVVTSHDKKRRIALWLDPAFPDHMKPVLQAAISIYLTVATDYSVVTEAYLNSTETAGPIPSKEQEDYLYLYSVSAIRPQSVELFTSQLAQVLNSDTDIPAIVISSYAGGKENVWWGGGLYDSYGNPKLWLTRVNPKGFLYIRLNSDRMASDQIRHDDPKFWASKISHEIAHNLGYWHPSYASPDERDTIASVRNRPFIYAYELAVLAAADKLK